MALDDSNNNYTLRLQNIDNQSIVPGVAGMALNITQSTVAKDADVVYTPDSFPLLNMSSVMFWAFPNRSHTALVAESVNGSDGSTKQAYVVAPHEEPPSNSSGYVAAISVSRSGVSIYARSIDQFSPILVAGVDINGWTLVTVLFTGTQAELYLNGTFVKRSLSLEAPLRLQFASIGSAVWGSYQGLLDDFRVYSRLLSSVDMQRTFLGHMPEPGKIIIIQFTCIVSWLFFSTMITSASAQPSSA